MINYFNKNGVKAAGRVTVLYQLLMVLLIILFWPRIALAPFWLVLHLIIVSIIWKLPDLQQNKFVRWFRFWNPVAFILINFTELHYLVHTIHPTDMDPLLIQMDYFLFSTHPTVWLEHLLWPPFTEYLQLVYTSFYFLPIILIVLLKRQKRFDDVDFIISILVYGFYLSYIGYFLVPAIGPRFTLTHLQTKTISGLWLTPVIRHTLDTLENIQRDAFPSGHTEITALTMFYAWKYHRKYFYVLAVVGTSLIFSTVYLRYHYVSDVIGGLLLAAFVVLTSKPVYRFFSVSSEKKS